MPESVELVESALLTFLPADIPEQSRDGSVYESFGPQDKDFTDYWWDVIARKVQGTDKAAVHAAGGEDSVRQALTGRLPPRPWKTSTWTSWLRSWRSWRNCRTRRSSETSPRKNSEPSKRVKMRSKPVNTKGRWKPKFTATGKSGWLRMRCLVAGGSGEGRVRVTLRGGITGETTQSMQWSVAAGQTICLTMELNAASSSRTQQRDLAQERVEEEGVRKKQKTEKGGLNDTMGEYDGKDDANKGPECKQEHEVNNDEKGEGPGTTSTDTKGEGLWPGLNPGSATTLKDAVGFFCTTSGRWQGSAVKRSPGTYSYVQVEKSRKKALRLNPNPKTLFP